MIAFAFFANGCLEYEENMIIKKDGSGSLTLKLNAPEEIANDTDRSGNQIPPLFDEDGMKKGFESNGGVTVTKIKSYTDAEKKWIEISLDFNSFKSLSESEMGGGGFIGQMSLSEDGDGNLLFSREICLESCDEEKENPNAEASQKMFASFNWIYEINFPSKVLSVNTSDDNIDHANNKVKWTFSMGAIAKENQFIKATFVNPGLNQGADLGLILIIIVSLGAITMIALNRKK